MCKPVDAPYPALAPATWTARSLGTAASQPHPQRRQTVSRRAKRRRANCHRPNPGAACAGVSRICRQHAPAKPAVRRPLHAPHAARCRERAPHGADRSIPPASQSGELHSSKQSRPVGGGNLSHFNSERLFYSIHRLFSRRIDISRRRQCNLPDHSAVADHPQQVGFTFLATGTSSGSQASPSTRVRRIQVSDSPPSGWTSPRRCAGA